MKSISTDHLDRCPPLAMGKGNRSIRVFDNGQVKRVLIHPAADHNHIIIRYESGGEGLVNIRIYCMLGYEAITQSQMLNAGTNLFEINCTLLKHGMYIVETSIDDSTEGLIMTYNKMEVIGS